jgi:hypothetical protein
MIENLSPDPYPQPVPPATPARSEPRNGYGVTSLVAGLVGIVPCLMFFGAVNRLTGAAPAASSSVSQGAVTSRTKSFGDTATWPDGHAVTVSEPKPFTPSATAATDDSSRYLVVTIVIKNGSTKEFKPGGTTLNASADGVAAGRVFDSKNKITSEPSTTVLPGKSVTYRAVLGVQSAGPADLQVDVSPSFGIGYQPAIFTGRG